MKQTKNKETPKLHFTIYKTTNLVNGMIYVGKHMTEDLNDCYIGSGTYFWKAVQKYGVKNFKKEILFDFDTEQEMIDKEREIVNEEFITRDDTYNLIVGGTGLFNRLHGCHSNSKGNGKHFSKLNTMPWIWICNPYSGEKTRSWNLELTPEQIAEGWEYGPLSKYNLLRIEYMGKTMSLAMFCHEHDLDNGLAYDRLQNSWSVAELLEIPESLKLCKTQEEFNSVEQEKQQKQQEARRLRRKQRHLEKIETDKRLAQKTFKEFLALGREKFAAKYPDKKFRKQLFKIMNAYVPEYKPYKLWSSRPKNITFHGITHCVSKWLNIIGSTSQIAYIHAKKAGISIESFVEQMLENYFSTHEFPE